ncbi:MAG: nucleotide exchange factor GrpE [Patescibacteria group bacterium]|nr:nucleotide exchange factor GrpE [Patescibacteria group bacterium]MBU1870945.1 nucleotide exchange factor GrpE [Patescibacteria group bacterium]
MKIGIYKHYKGAEYRVLFSGYNSENKEEVVIYQSIIDNKIWVRPKKMFLNQVEVDGKKINRFEYINNNSDDLEAKYKRALADYQNLLKQTAKEKIEFIEFANRQLLHEILPIYDNLKISIQHVDESAKKNSWAIGIEYIIKQFSEVLKKLGIEEIKIKDKKFDHNLMEAISSKETEDKNLDGQVVEQVKAGYLLNGRMIAAAKVIIYKFK